MSTDFSSCVSLADSDLSTSLSFNCSLKVMKHTETVKPNTAKHVDNAAMVFLQIIIEVWNKLK